MAVLVKETGFVPDDFEETGRIVSLDDLLTDTVEHTGQPLGVDLPNDANADDLISQFDRVAMIRIPLPVFADGRAFSLARRLRSLGYQGRLRAAGHVLVDQARAARRVGFNEIEISDELARRQPAEHWLGVEDRYSYQNRVHKTPNAESVSP